MGPLRRYGYNSKCFTVVSSNELSINQHQTLLPFSMDRDIVYRYNIIIGILYGQLAKI